MQAECGRNTLTSDQCYEAFKAIGFEYGPGHRGIESVHIGSGQVLAKLALPASVSGTRDQFVLHPSLMDSALQASISLMAGPDDPAASMALLKPALPFALEELHVLDRCSPTMWASIRNSEGSKAEGKVRKLDIDICDERGNVCVRMKGFSTRVPEEEAAVRRDAAARAFLERAGCCPGNARFLIIPGVW